MLKSPHLLLVIVIMVAGGGLAAAVEAAQKPAEVRPGRAEYVEMGCYQCHGYEGQGGRGTGPRIAPRPLDWEVFAAVVRQPPKVMPAYSPRVLSEDKLKRIHAYLVSVPPPPAVSSVPALSGK